MAKLTAELAYWIDERYCVKVAKESKAPPPWSTDPIFNSVRFCNVHREDDRVTRWMRTHWNRPLDPVWKFVVGRMINLPESLQTVVRCETPWQMKDALKKYRATGAKVFTGAYTISTCGRKMDKLDYVFDHVVERVAQAGAPDYATLADTARCLQAVDGVGSFLAAQVVADMKNTPAHPLAAAPDWWTWSAPGPGSLRGLSWYFNKELMLEGVQCIGPASYAAALRNCRAEVDPLVLSSVPRIGDQDFQNCLCEFSKWCRVKYLNGHVRNRYDPFNHSA
jgi:hypothetical protein